MFILLCAGGGSIRPIQLSGELYCSFQDTNALRLPVRFGPPESLERNPSSKAALVSNFKGYRKWMMGGNGGRLVVRPRSLHQSM
jgi:hypothetical protein